MLGKIKTFFYRFAKREEPKPVIVGPPVIEQIETKVINLNDCQNPSVISHIIIHHSLSIDGKTRNWDAIRKYHMSWRRDGQSISEKEAADLIALGEHIEKPWSDIGYHLGIELIGSRYEIQRGRPLNKRGAHAADGGFNRRSIGLCCVGNFDLVEPPAAQWDLAVLTVRDLMRYYAENDILLTVKNILGHGESQILAGVKPKTCPGRLFDMDKFRSNVSEAL